MVKNLVKSSNKKSQFLGDKKSFYLLDNILSFSDIGAIRTIVLVITVGRAPAFYLWVKLKLTLFSGLISRVGTDIFLKTLLNWIILRTGSK
jgi:hypothetical protein